MAAEPPVPAEQLSDGPPATPRPAASVILVRGGAEALELLLVRRSSAQRFMGGIWVFPGGAVDPGDGGGEDAFRRAAVREVAEEVAVVLPDPAGLVALSRWIAPVRLRTRFDTWFFLAPLPPGAVAAPDGAECVDAAWLTPPAALQAYARGALELVFPTLKHLELLTPFASADALLRWARGREVVAVEPRIVGAGAQARTLLPGDPGYDEG